MLPTRQTPDLLLGTWSLIEQFGRVPRRLIWDNETGIGRRGRLAAGVAEFCGTLATRLHQLKPHDPESKGVVERRNGFFETSFMPGRSFESPADFNTSSPSGWSGPTVARCARSRPARSTWSTLTGRRCWRCRRSHPGSAGRTRSGWVATTTCASTPATTPSTRPRSAARSPSPPIWNGCGCASMAASSPTTPGCGPAT